MGGPVEYNHVIIKGDLDLSQLNLPKGHINRSSYDIAFLGLSENAQIVTSNIKIINATIDGNVNFGKTAFYSPIDFSGSNFTGFAIFHGAQFSVYTNVFSDAARFSGSANFNNVRFNNGADFTGASGPVSFMHAQFNNTAHFWGAQLYYPNFSNAQFITEYTDFRKTQFIGLTSFSEAQFSDVPLFGAAQFNGDTYFRGTKFSEKASFVGGQFNKDVDFTYAKFGGDADFSGAKFNGYISGWGYLQKFLKCNEATYLGLIKTLKDHGQFGAADDCYYAYRYQYMSIPSDYLIWISCGFGVRWTYTLASGVVILIIFSLIYLFKSQPDAIKSINRIKQITMRKLYESLLFSLIILISAPSDLYPYGLDKYNNFISLNRYFVILERILGWGLLILFINTMSRVMIRY